jgi:nucleoside-diphosphate-sugar epimerase
VGTSAACSRPAHRRGDGADLRSRTAGADVAAAEFVAGDVRDRAAIRGACDGIDIVFHNVAQVPLAKDRDLFDSVNVTGSARMLVAARPAWPRSCTSSGAVFGIPSTTR